MLLSERARDPKVSSNLLQPVFFAKITSSVTSNQKFFAEVKENTSQISEKSR